MPDYREILEFLAKNPPQLDSERALHASLLELLASCLRNESAELAAPDGNQNGGDLDARIKSAHAHWVNFS